MDNINKTILLPYGKRHIFLNFIIQERSEFSLDFVSLHR